MQCSANKLQNAVNRVMSPVLRLLGWPYCGLHPGCFLAGIVHVALLVHLEAQLRHLLQIPAAGHNTLATIFRVHGIAQFDVIGPATNSLRIGPLEAVAILLTLGSAGAGVLVCWTVVGDGSDGEVVPPFFGGALAEKRMRVSEERGVDEGFLQYGQRVRWGDADGRRTWL